MPYNLDLATKCVKNIVDGIRCTICDRIDEGRSRYACGHTACSDCVVTAQSCLLCLTPPTVDEVYVDEPLTRRAKNAAELLSAFQNTFDVDVVRHHRISEQLKIEKELFPECIQATRTYFNKRKSSGSVIGRSSILSGETVEPSRMTSSRNFLQEWLESNENELGKFKPRQALSDLKINTPRSSKSPIKKRADRILDKVRGSENQPSITKSRKRSFKTALAATKSQSQLDKYLKTTGTRRNAKEVRREFEHHEKTALSKNDKDESGIVMDDEPIVIDDSQSPVVDKDKQAWLAVLKACENATDTSQKSSRTLNNYPAIVESFSLKQPEKIDSATSENKTKSRKVKVPFYKKSSFLPSLKTSYKEEISKSDPVQYKAKDVSITVETQALITTIQVTTYQKPVNNKISKSVQTDLAEDFVANLEDGKSNKKDMGKETHEREGTIKKVNELDSTDVLMSQDLFTGAPNKDAPETDIPEQIKKSVINECSSDSEHEHSSLLVVTADVHHDVRRGVLTEIDDAAGSLQRPAKRGRSPVSSNSSNKENYNPNARKRPRESKKKKRGKTDVFGTITQVS